MAKQTEWIRSFTDLGVPESDTLRVGQVLLRPLAGEWKIFARRGAHPRRFYGESKSLRGAKKKAQTALKESRIRDFSWTGDWEPHPLVLVHKEKLHSPHGGDYRIRILRSAPAEDRDPEYLLYIDGVFDTVSPHLDWLKDRARDYVRRKKPKQHKLVHGGATPSPSPPRKSGGVLGVPWSATPADRRARWKNGTYICTLIAPKSLSPVEIRVKGNKVLAGSPDGTRAFGVGYFGSEGDEMGVECTRQHMLPGLLNPEDQGKALGVALYLGGCITNKVESGWIGEGDCTFSVEDNRSASASAVWDSMVIHGLATDYSGARKEACDHHYPDADDLAANYLDINVDDIEEVSLEPDSIYICAIGSVEGNQLLYDTVADAGLVLHSNGDPNIDDLQPTEPEVFNRLRYDFAPPELVVEWIFWGATSGTLDTDDVDEDWLRAAVRGLPREIRAIVRPELEFRVRQLEFDFEARTNPRSDRLAKLWMQEYGPRSRW